MHSREGKPDFNGFSKYEGCVKLSAQQLPSLMRARKELGGDTNQGHIQETAGILKGALSLVDGDEKVVQVLEKISDMERIGEDVIEEELIQIIEFELARHFPRMTTSKE